MVDDSTPTRDRRSFLKTTGALGAAAAMGGVAAAETPGRSPGPKEDELLVGYSAKLDAGRAERMVRANAPGRAEVVHTNEDLGYMAVRVPDRAADRAEQAMARAMENERGIRYVERNATVEAFLTPDDDLFGDQYAPQQVNAPTAWDTTLGSADVTVAVVDQGVKYDHPDLEAQFGADEGRDFVDGDGDPFPDDLQDEYHGTHVAGIAAATTDNGTGVSGISNASLLSGRALSEDGYGSTSDIADAVQWAADQGADIVNLSLGGGGYTETMKNAVSYAVDNGALPVAAAGNDGTRGVSYPAAYDETVAVSALDRNEDLASFSQYGPGVDVAAPGVDVLSTWTTSDRYNRISGTSMACPAAAGVAALGKAVDSSLSPTQLRSRLKDTAADVGLSSEEQGSGRVDAANIVGDDGGDGGDGGDGSTCGDANTTASVSDYLWGYYDGDAYRYASELSDPCQVTFSLSGPADADFDLYVTFDGRTPSPSDYDERSITRDSQETVIVDDVSAGQEFGVLVDSYYGSGSYTLDVEELGK